MRTPRDRGHEEKEEDAETTSAPLKRRHTTTQPAVKLEGHGTAGVKEEVREQEDEEEALQFDRDFYDADEEGGVDMERDPFYQYGDVEETATSTAASATAAAASDAAARSRGRQTQRESDGQLWEERQMELSGVVRTARRTLAEMNRDESEVQVTLLVNDPVPRFLEDQGARARFTRLQDPVYPVLDPASDLARFAREGSRLVRETRERQERERGAREHVDVAGTALGHIIGATKQQDPDDSDVAAVAAVADSASSSSSASSVSSSQYAKYSKGQETTTATETTETAEGETETATATGATTTATATKGTGKTLQEQRRQLPIYECRRDLMRIIAENQIVVVVGETGSGKTTQLTQYLHEDGYTRGGLAVCCTQPRRVAAVSVAKRVAEEVGCAVGTTVGYTIRFEDCSGAGTAIRYMTEGLLLRETLVDPLLERYGAVVMDEAHERSLSTDILFGILRRVVAQRRDLKLVVTSATMDSDKFAAFFGHVPVFTIPGRTYPVDLMFSKVPCADYVEAAVRQALTVHLSYPPGDILVFMTGQEDIEVACAVLGARLRALGADARPLLVLPIYSQLPADLQTRIFERAGGGARKCIVATNIAETSLTVDGIRYVVDSGYCKLKVYNPRVGMDTLQVFPISRQNAVQRAGRAGRTQPGVCFRMYTERAFKYEMLRATVPEIQRTNLANTVLLLKSLGVDDLLAFDFMDAPPADTIVTALFQLWALGALDALGHLTPLGRAMVQYPLDPALSKMLLVAADHRCAAEMATVVAMLNVPTVFYRPKERAAESDAAHEKFFVPESDHLTLLHVYQQWVHHGCRADWCRAHFLHAKALLKVRDIRAQLVDILKRNMPPTTTGPSSGSSGAWNASCGADWDVLRKAIAAAYFANAARFKSVAEYTNLRTGLPCHLHPTSALAGLGITPDYVVYHELVLTTREYMQCVTAVDPLWLAELAPMFFSLKDDWRARQQHRRDQRLALAQQHADALQRQQLQQRLVAHAPAPAAPATTAGTTAAGTLAATKERVPATRQTFFEVGGGGGGGGGSWRRRLGHRV